MHADSFGSAASDSDHVFMAKHVELIVKGGTVLSTRMGQSLKKSRWMAVALVASLLGAILSFAVGALATNQFYETSDYNGVVKRRARPNAGMYIGCICLCVFYVLYLHHVNREVFLNCVRSFDSIIITSAIILEFLCTRYNWYIVFVQAGLWDGAEVVALILEAFVTLFAALLIATLDSLMVPRCHKVLACFIFLAACLFSYLWTRFGGEETVWSDEDVVWWLVRASPKQVCLSCQLQQVLFLSKGSFAYARGSHFWHIRTSYELVHSRSEDVGETAVERANSNATSHSADFTNDTVQQLSGNASSNRLATDLALSHLASANISLALDLRDELSSSRSRQQCESDLMCLIDRVKSSSNASSSGLTTHRELILQPSESAASAHGGETSSIAVTCEPYDNVTVTLLAMPRIFRVERVLISL